MKQCCLAALLSAAVASASAAETLETRLERLGRILALERARVSGSPELARLLRDESPTVRRRAALAAGRIPDLAARQQLVDLMNDPVTEVRRMAAFSLGLAGEPRGVERLVAALGDDDGVVRARAAEALGRLGGKRAAQAVAEYVLASLPEGAPLVTVRGDDPGNPLDPWIELRLGLLGLARAGDVDAAERALLHEGRPRFDWWAATYVAMRLGSARLRPVLLAAAASEDPRSRALAARGLGALEDPAAVDLLATLVRDPDEEVALAAVRGLARIPQRSATLAVGTALRSPGNLLPYAALLALPEMPRERSLREHIVSLLGAEAPWLRAAALPAFARTAPEELPLILSGLDAQPPWRERVARARALGIAGGEIAVGILHAMLSDDDARVLPSVLEALRRSRGSDAEHTLLTHLEHRDVVVRAVAAQQLRELGATQLAGAVLAALERAERDVVPDARLALVALLASQSDPSAGTALRALAETARESVVRQAALQALAERGQEHAGAAPRQPPARHLDDIEAMLPYDPRRGEPLFSPRAVLHTSRGEVEIALDLIEAPLATRAFVVLARRGYYDGLDFHRFVPGFVIQGGCPRGDGHGGPGYALPTEPGSLPFGRGAVGVANAGRDTDGSQFFVTLTPQPQLDGVYTQLGRVTRGLEVVEQIRPGDVIRRVEIWDGS